MLMILAVGYTTQAVAKDRPEWDSNPDLCNAGAVLYQLSYQATLGPGHYVGLWLAQDCD